MTCSLGSRPTESGSYFISDRSGNDNIWTIGADGVDPTAVTDDKGAKFASPAWTPDGQYIVARRRDLINIVMEPVESDPSFELYLVNVRGGSGFKIVADGRNPAGPAASPDGRFWRRPRRRFWRHGRELRATPNIRSA